ncbi:MAG: AAA family ATPase [Patescibacteria group bacterium]
MYRLPKAHVRRLITPELLYFLYQLEKPLLVVVTGGPMAGKTTVMDFIQDTLGFLVRIVPEAATFLFKNGYPIPTEAQAKSSLWQRTFNNIIVPLTMGLEDKALNQIGCPPLVFGDRGVGDGDGYHLEGGSSGFYDFHNFSPDLLNQRYTMVFHLTSLAVTNPAQFEKNIQEGNMARYETSAAQAQKLDKDLMEAWKPHRRHIVITETSVEQLVQSFTIALLNNLMEVANGG